MKISARKRAKKRIQRDFFHDMILDSNESAIFALVIKTVYIKMAKVGYISRKIMTVLMLRGNGCSDTVVYKS